MLKKQWLVNTFSNFRVVMIITCLVFNIILAGALCRQWIVSHSYEKDIEQKQVELDKYRNSMDEAVKAQLDSYYAQQLQKLMSEQELSFLAQKQWKYILTLNGKIVTKDILYINDTSAHIILAEVVQDKDILPSEILKKGTITGSDSNDHLQDHLSVITNIPYTTKTEETAQGRRVIYDFKDIPNGTIINLKPSVLLTDRLGVGEEGAWNSHIEIIRQ
ncbi:hypothetical protein [Petroclostridium sp. X23]|uniref:hypothetical protein n=1 Tax=Petroclostridium sp. X23 TaxID=3045146 RepID=UPI0024AD3D5F|nr:hypothetical protein [Petroclostridium sp. X23]WHH57515.1 hypothetical protein QKW49_16985 [Petroclostridium sp. X23]